MSSTAAFAYAGARVQASYGRLLSEGQWERLARIPDFRLFLQSARDTSLRPWVLNLDAGADAHTVETHLRAHFRGRVDDVASWAPPEWQPALRWIATAPDLAAAWHLLAGGPAYPWVGAEPALARLQSPGAGDPLKQGWDEGVGLASAWLRRWRALWPAMDATQRHALERLIGRLDGALRAFVHEDAAAARARVQPELRRLFRRHTRAPAGLVAYLVLSWLEMTRLRGGLSRRRLSLPLEQAA